MFNNAGWVTLGHWPLADFAIGLMCYVFMGDRAIPCCDREAEWVERRKSLSEGNVMRTRRRGVI